VGGTNYFTLLLRLVDRTNVSGQLSSNSTMIAPLSKVQVPIKCDDRSGADNDKGCNRRPRNNCCSVNRPDVRPSLTTSHVRFIATGTLCFGRQEYIHTTTTTRQLNFPLETLLQLSIMVVSTFHTPDNPVLTHATTSSDASLTTPSMRS